jgi:hypothetical protein
VAQLKNCPFYINAAIELKTVTPTNNNKLKNPIKVNTLKTTPKY